MLGALLAVAVLVLVNHQRVERHERALPLDPRLELAARHCHERPGLLACVRRYGYPARAVGMNTASGFRTARGAVRAWMRSPGHRANILDRRWRATGVFVVGRRYVQVFAGPALAHT